MKNPIPYRVNEENIKFFKITQIVYYIGLFGHLSAIGMFWWMGIKEMVLFNLIISIPSFSIALILNRLGHHSFAFALGFIELFFHQILGIYFTGWETGFQFWLIYLAALSFFNARWKSIYNYIGLLLVIAGYTVSYYMAREGVYQLADNITHFFYVQNAVVAIGLISLLINYYAKTALLSEQKLQKEKELTENQNIQLIKQHEALVKEQDKTYNMLNKIESLFGQQVSEEVAQEMIQTEHEIDSKIMEVTVMFLDIRDFTLFADSREPAEVAEFQNIVFGALIDLVRDNKGIVSQILGDGIMAVFGAPTPNTMHAKHALNAGYAMVKKIEELGKSGKIPKIKVGIGLNSGKVMAGNVGNESRKFYSLTGSNVIIAARIEQLNKNYKSQFLVSSTTVEKARIDKNLIEDLGDLILKGIENKIKVYKLI